MSENKNVTNENIASNTTEKKLDFDTFIKEYNKRATQNLKDKYLKDHVVVKKYIPWQVKLIMCETINSKSNYDDDGNIRIDSFKKYILYVYNMISEWTNIGVDATNWGMQFNQLEESGLTEKILALIPVEELERMKTILKMQNDDFISNSYCVPAILNNMFSLVKMVAPEFSKALHEELQDKNIIDIVTATKNQK